MSSTLLQSVTAPTPTATRLNRGNLSPPSGLSSPHQATSFLRRAERSRVYTGVRIGWSSSSVYREHGGLTEEEAAAAAFFGGGDELADEEESDGDDGEEGDAESSVDLLIRFLQSIFGKVARRAKKASRSVLPPAIPPQLVSFAVDGILLLASVSIVKALLEVACTLGGTVFAVILLVRVIWATASHFQSNGNTFGAGRPAI